MKQVLALLVAVTALTASPARAATITALPPEVTSVAAVNSSGESVGLVKQGSKVLPAFVEVDGTVTLAQGPGGVALQLFDINDAGQASGTACTAPVDTCQQAAAVWSPSHVPTAVPPLPDRGPMEARHINDNGDVAGFTLAGSHRQRGWLAPAGGQPVLVGTADAPLSGDWDSEVEGLSNTRATVGQISGQSISAYLWSSSGVAGTPLADTIFQPDRHWMSDDGWVVTGGRSTPYVLRDPQGNSTAVGLRDVRAVNSRHEVVGLDQQYYAAVSFNGTIVRLDSLLPAGSGWSGLLPVDIADDGTIAGTGVLNGSARSFVLTRDDAPLIVNSTADRPRAAAAPATACDTGEEVDGAAECTLRAALQAVEDGATPARVTFAIAGAENPVIAPGSALPKVTKPIEIDGTTQGSWVVLSGADAGDADGLEVDGAGSTVTGLVVNGFAKGAGIVAGGSLGLQAVTGNRIGTNPAGTQAVPNQVGVLLHAPDVRVGGTAGTRADSCTGACNLIAGNTYAQVTNGRPGERVPPFLAARIQGNWIGLGTGGGVLTAPGDGVDGIVMTPGASGQETTAFPAGAELLIGGPTSAPGAAPGNRIAATGDGISVNSGAQGAGQPKYGGTATIAGNAVGLTAAGTAAAGRGRVGIAVFNPNAGPFVVGGPSGSGNAIGGWEWGVDASQAQVLGNRVGTDPTGTVAVPNDVGVRGDGLIADNLISGNHVGAGDQRSVFLDHGNVIGLAADGRTPLPNDIGVGSDAALDGAKSIIIGSRGGCGTGPCNVIAGNRVAGVRGHGPLVALIMQGTYIGTDVTGTRAVPNGVGVDLASTLSQLDVGGATSVARGRPCRAACNVIAGNTGPGLRLASVGQDVAGRLGSVAGNVIGVATDGMPLPNGGAAQVVVEGTPALGADPFTIGGTPEQGNLIAARGGPAVAVGGRTDAYPAAAFRSNRFRMLDASTPITRPPFTANAPVLDGYGVTGRTATVAGSTRVTADPVRAAETVELYASTACEGPRDLVPIATAATAKRTGDFAIEAPLSGLAGMPVLSVLRTDQANATSSFSACLQGPRITSTTKAVKAKAKELPVASNTGWKAGDYALLDVSPTPVVRRVAKLGSLILAAPVGRAVPQGTTVVSVPPPRGDRGAPRVRVRVRKRYRVGERASIAVRCTDRPSANGKRVGVAHCPGRLRLATNRVRRMRIRVRAWDRNGNLAVRTITYRVVPR